ncbi:Hpt domain-containing protein, partial [Vibrio sp. M260118]
MDILDQSKIDRLASEIGEENVPVLLEIFLGELKMYIDQLSQLEGSEQEDY